MKNFKRLFFRVFSSFEWDTDSGYKYPTRGEFAKDLASLRGDFFVVGRDLERVATAELKKNGQLQHHRKGEEPGRRPHAYAQHH